MKRVTPLPLQESQSSVFLLVGIRKGICLASKLMSRDIWLIQVYWENGHYVQLSDMKTCSSVAAFKRVSKKFLFFSV